MKFLHTKAAIFFITSILVAGCTTPGLVMKIEAPSAQPKLLLGQFTGSVALLQGNPKNAEIHATDGSLTCSGQSDNGQFSTDMITNRIAHIFSITCSNGTTGQLFLNMSATFKWVASVNGVGIGTLSDGSKIKVIVGDMSGQLLW